ncbi:MAG: IclR family transcriptional regulator [Pseudomonadota bacterium]
MAKASESSIVTKCALLLDVLAASRSPMTFSQIVEETGFVKSSCHRILAVLVGERMVAYDKATRKYKTGERLSDWSRLAWRRVDLQEIASAEMRALSDSLKVNVALSILDRDTILYLRTVDHIHLRYAATMGDHAPLHCTAAGKVFLAFMPEAKRRALLSQLPLEKITERTITNVDDLTVELDAIAQAGHALALEEEFKGVYGLALPVWNEDRSVAACLSLWKTSASPEAREDLTACLEELTAASRRISKELGWRET